MITSRRIMIFTFLARLLALTLPAMTPNSIFNFMLKAKFSNSPTFKYFVVVEAVACAYNLVIMFLASDGSLWRLVINFDMVVAVLLASSALASVGKKRNTHAGLLLIVDKWPSFATMSLQQASSPVLYSC